MHDPHPPRLRHPDLERDLVRSPALGFEPPETGTVRCLAHGYPTPLARWHVHDECELHLITATRGRVFVGDWIGPFEPGHLVLVGPRLPHNWVSTDLGDASVAERDRVIHFPQAPLLQAAQHLPELGELAGLLERAQRGIEFFGQAESALAHWHEVKRRKGLERLLAFAGWLAELAQCEDWRSLSSVQMRGQEAREGEDGTHDHDALQALVQRVLRDHAQPLVAGELAAQLGMSESQFSRAFRRATGNTFVDFLNRLRVNHAGQLLMETDLRITHICYEVGFNNVANFNRRFLAVKGMTPSEFRRQALHRFDGQRLAR